MLNLRAHLTTAAMSRGFGTELADPSMGEARPLTTDELRAHQNVVLATGVARVYAGSEFYRAKLDRSAVSPSDIGSLEDLPKLPFTTKGELRAAYPLGILAVARDEVVRIHASSGTTGTPTVTAYTASDIALWTTLCARVLATAGVGPGTVVHNAFGYGLFTGGLAFHYACERLGALMIPASNVAQPLQARLLRDLGASVLLCTPSMAVALAEVISATGVDPRTLGVKAGVLGGEPWSDGLRNHIEALWGMTAYDTYGLSEIIGPGVAHECAAKAGLHVYEDHFIAEIVDPETGAPLPDGELGELVITALTKAAQPMLRYRTGDHTAITRLPCRCGSPFARIRKVLGRADDRFAVGDRLLFPTEVEDALLGLPGVAPHYQIVRGADRLTAPLAGGSEQQLVVRVEGVDMGDADTIARALGEQLACPCVVTSVAPGGLPRSTGKAQRIIYG